MLMLVAALVRLAEQGPEPEDVKGGWLALTVFLGLAAAVVLLAFSLVKQLRKAQRAKEAGVYGDDAVEPGEQPGEQPGRQPGREPGDEGR